MRSTISSRRLAQGSAACGLAVWTLLHFFAYPGQIEEVLLVGPLVVVPLGLGLCPPDRWLLPARWIQPAAAFALVAAFLQSPGRWAALLTLPWLAVGALAGISGGAAILRKPFGFPRELPRRAALLFLAIGCGWVTISRAGVRPFDFGDTIVLLTGVHFHFAGFSAALITAMIGEDLDRPHGAYAYSAAAVTFATPLLAAGITYSPLLELLAAFFLASGLVCLAVLVLAHFGATRILLLVSSVSLIVSMGFAACYAVGEYLERGLFDIPLMTKTHGYLNAFGFALCGTLAFRHRIS